MKSKVLRVVIYTIPLQWMDNTIGNQPIRISLKQTLLPSTTQWSLSTRTPLNLQFSSKGPSINDVTWGRRTSVAWLPKLNWFSCFHPEDPAEFVNKSNIFVFVLALFSHSKNFSCYLRQRARWKTRILDLLTKFCRVFRMKTAESLELTTTSH